MKEVTDGGPEFGVTLFDEDEFAEAPAAFVAVTVNVYAVPFVRPETAMGLPVEDAAMLPGLETAV